MYRCPNCSAQMRFDIASQELHCDYCGASTPISDHPDEKVAREEKAFDVTIFSCPQCGAEIMSTENAATGFCSYCGASVLLEGRMGKGKAPKVIIPFQKTKEECQEIYRKKLKTAWFVPGEFKDAQHIDRVRGMYLPYWVFDVEQKKEAKLRGTRVKGNYQETLSLKANLDNSYKGLSRDASSAFDDSICDWIAPFSEKAMKPFTPAYLAGFYADVADVGSKVYNESVKAEINNRTKKLVKAQYPGTSISFPVNLTRAFGTTISDVKSAMFPVWFLTWRRNDRVAYAVINGETGKISADLPVDPKKYVLGSLILSVPIFLLILAVGTIKAKALIIVAMILGVLMLAAYGLNLWELYRRENRLDDLGFLEARKKEAEAREEAAAREMERIQEEESMQEVAGGAYVLVNGKAVLKGTKADVTRKQALRNVKARAAQEKKEKAEKRKESVKAAIDSGNVLMEAGPVAAAVLVSLVIRLAHPVADVPYYVGVILIMLTIGWAVIGLIRKYNKLTTRPIPEFHERKGGEEYV